LIILNLSTNDPNKPHNCLGERKDRMIRRKARHPIVVSCIAALGITAGALVATVAPTKALPAALTAAQAAPPPPGPEQTLKDLGISGYVNHLSVQPGQTETFMVSSETSQYSVQMMRLYNMDSDPRGPGIQETPISAPANGTHAGFHQDLGLGSYVTVPDNSALRLSRSFTITAWISPTTIPGSTWNLLASPDTPAHSPRPQGIVTKWSDNTGYGLYLDKTGSLSLSLGAGGHTVSVSTGVPLRPSIPSFPGWKATANNDPSLGSPQGVRSTWYFVAAAYDAKTGAVTLYQNPATDISDPTSRLVTKQSGLNQIDENRSPLRIGAGSAASDAVGDVYNGKIDDPRIYPTSLSAAQLKTIEHGASPTAALANWDFSRGISSDRVYDSGPHGLNGTAVNLPERGVTGHNWDASEDDYRVAPDQYGAIYFHQDDLGDARWKPGFQYKVPQDLESGVYAAKLQAGDKTFYVPFFVRPQKGTATASTALVIPTFSYYAYGKIGSSPWAMSLYSRHVDGSGVSYSSFLRPLTTMQPVSQNPRHFAGDMQLVYWLHTQGQKVDILTDQDVQAEGASLLKRYRVVITGQHPEYISGPERAAFATYEHTGRLMYLGGNGFYWVTGLAKSGKYIEVRRRDGTQAWQAAPGESHLSTTGEEGGLWQARGLPPQQIVGEGFDAQGYGGPNGTATDSRPYERTPDSTRPDVAFVFKGIGPNESIGNFPSLYYPSNGPAGDELDRVDYALGSPPNTVVLGTATGFSNGYQFVIEDLNASDSMEGGPDNPLVRSDIAYAKFSGGGAFFSVGSISWDSSLLYNGGNNNVSQITKNVLDTFSSPSPLP
jgi:N,N-dimethylformamidase